MGNPIWQEARTRARAETLELLRLNSVPRVLLTIGSPLMAFGATLGLTGQLAIATAATLAWTLLCGVFMYLGKLVRAPARIAAEKQQELEAALATRTTDEERQTKRTTLALGIQAGERLKMACGVFNKPIPTEEIATWNQAMLELAAELGPEYPTLFASDAGLHPFVPTGVTLSNPQRDRWIWLDRRLQRLHQFMNETR